MAKKNILASAVLGTAIATTPNVDAKTNIELGANSVDKNNPALNVAIDNNKTAVKAILDPGHQALVVGKATDGAYVIVGGSKASESKNGVTLKWNSLFAEWAITNPTDKIKFVRAGVSTQKIKWADLGTSVDSFSSTDVKVENYVKTTTTTTTNIATHKSLKGGRSTKYKLETGVKVGKNGTIIPGVAYTQGHNPKGDKRLAGNLGYEHNFDNGSKLLVEYDTNNNARATTYVQANDNLSFYAGGSVNTKRWDNKTAFAGIRYEFGKKSSHRSIPNPTISDSQRQMIDRVNSYNISSPEIVKNLHDQVIQKTSRKIWQTVDTQTEQLEKPTPQPTTPPEANPTPTTPPEVVPTPQPTIETRIETLPFDLNDPNNVEIVYTDDVKIGETKVQTPGSPAEKRIKEEVYPDGTRKVVWEEIIKEAVKEVRLVGTYDINKDPVILKLIEQTHKTPEEMEQLWYWKEKNKYDNPIYKINLPAGYTYLGYNLYNDPEYKDDFDTVGYIGYEELQDGSTNIMIADNQYGYTYAEILIRHDKTESEKIIYTNIKYYDDNYEY